MSSNTLAQARDALREYNCAEVYSCAENEGLILSGSTRPLNVQGWTHISEFVKPVDDVVTLDQLATTLAAYLSEGENLIHSLTLIPARAAGAAKPATFLL